MRQPPTFWYEFRDPDNPARNQVRRCPAYCLQGANEQFAAEGSKCRWVKLKNKDITYWQALDVLIRCAGVARP